VVSATSLVTAERGAPASFDVELLSTPAAPVDVEIVSGDASEGLVLTPGYAVPGASRQLTFTPDDWDVPRTITVHPVDERMPDGTVDYDVRCRVAFSEDPDYARVPSVAVRVTNADDDAPGITVSEHHLTTAEGGLPGAATFSVRLNADPGWLRIEVESTDPTEGVVSAGGASPAATTWLDFHSSSWWVPQTVTVTRVDDPATDGNRTYDVTLRVTSAGGESWTSLPADAVSVTNLDDDLAAFTVVPSRTPLVTREPGTAGTFAVVLNTPPSADVVIPVTSGAPDEGLVSAGGPPAASLSLTFTPSTWSLGQEVTVVGQDDEIPGDDVPYDVVVGPPTGSDPKYPLLAARTVPVLNLDDDVAVLSVLGWGSLATSESGTAESFPIGINRRPVADLIVPVVAGAPGEGLLLAEGSVLEPQPVVTVTFTELDWQTPKRVTVIGQRDFVVDGNRTWTIAVGPPAGDPAYAGVTASVQVLNSDVDAVGYTISAPSLSTTEGAAAQSFTVRLNTVPAGDVVVPVSTSRPSEALVSGGDSGGAFVSALNLTFTPADWRTPQTVLVRGEVDRVDDGQQAFAIAVGPASGDAGYAALGATAIPGWNGDVDSAGLLVTPTSVVVSEGGTTAEVAIRLATIPTAPVTATVGSSVPGEVVVSAGPGPGANQVTLTFEPGSWDVPQVVTLTGVDDAALDGDRLVSLGVWVSASDDPVYRNLGYSVAIWATSEDDESGVDEGTAADPVVVTSLPWPGQVGTGTSHYAVAVPAGAVQVSIIGATGDVSLEVDDDGDPANGILCTSELAGASAPERCTVAPGPARTLRVRVAGSATARGAAFSIGAGIVGWFASADVPKTIFDAGATISTLTVAGASTFLSKVRVRVDITHTFDSDLVLTLYSPGGTSVVLASRVGGHLDNFTATVFDDAAATAIASGAAPFTGSFRPHQPLGGLAGSSGNGTWTLSIRDVATPDAGRLEGWSLWLE
jgi:subtilisin-like proprotein convertase family protein